MLKFCITRRFISNFNILARAVYFALYLTIYKALLSALAFLKCFQCKKPQEKRQDLRREKDEERLPTRKGGGVGWGGGILFPREGSMLD